MTSYANVAATFMEHLCNCDAHGYSQSERWGSASKGTCYVDCEGVTGEFYKGDRDCSSAVIDAWQEAIKNTSYAGSLSGATYTGNMRNAFVNSGLFEWKDMSFSAQRGDIYLNEANHTAMCIYPYGSAEGDILGEFSISETGGVSGTSGDQTGRESYMHAYYDYPWDGILHYNGGADGSTQTDSSDGNTMSHVDIPNEADAVYRMYNPNNGRHLFTESHIEAQSLNDTGWQYEGVAFKSGGGEIVQRVYNPNTGAHLMTASQDEHNKLVAAGWECEGEGFRAGDQVDVYRLYNPNLGEHMFTTSDAEKASLLGSGWVDEGIAFRADE